MQAADILQSSTLLNDQLGMQVAFSYNLLDELLPLYASAPIELGGLLLPANQLAVPLMASGPVMIIFSIWILPPIQRTFSVLTTMRWSLLITAPLVLMVRISVCSGHTRKLVTDNCSFFR